ncbi:MAG: triose-phosphate isomerase [Desulfobulbia bacterium]
MNEGDVGAAPFCPICLAIRAMAPDTPILNGGWLKTKNIGEYRTLAGISGLMLGVAGLEPDEFGAMAEPAPRHRNQ